ncbi:regulatory protein GemA [Roseibium sp. SCP14]|uniref:regulatory protein GemA n=1 Tax=Roseibium sp. SCP14 TaxID=3141375 RepID=UPI00333B30DC
MTAIRKIHTLKSAAKLSEENFRALLERETGKSSTKAMTADERTKVIRVLEPLAPKRETQNATGKFARKLQALWIAAYNLGVVGNRSDQAMIAFLKRQTKLDHHRFLHDPKDANKAIDALKLWIRRATLNEGLFTKDHKLPPLYNDYRFQVCLHIWSELLKKDRHPSGSITEYLFTLTGKEDPLEINPEEWIRAQNRLGELHRLGQK